MELSLLHKFFANQTSKQEEETIRIWLNASPENKQIFLRERKLYDAFIINTNTSEIDSTSGQKEYKNIKNRLLPQFKEFTQIAAAVLITALCCWFYYSHINTLDNMAMQTISVPAGQRMNLILPDGTNVWINAKTTIKYPISFNRKERLVYLDGEAYFDVAKNDKVPFIVKTNIGSVKALGTQFDVMAYSDTHEFETALMEGSVKIDLLNDPTQTLILKPDNKAFVQDGQFRSAIVDDYSRYQWREGLISFKNEPFEDIMKSFEKTYDVKIIIENHNLTNKHLYTGKFRIVDGVDYALRVLQKDVNFQYIRNKEDNIIKIK
jgi:transmembrane sensor